MALQLLLTKTRYILITEVKKVLGADPGFSFRGGGAAQNVMFAHAHFERDPRSPLRSGSRALI